MLNNIFDKMYSANGYTYNDYPQAPETTTLLLPASGDQLARESH